MSEEEEVVEEEIEEIAVEETAGEEAQATEPQPARSPAELVSVVEALIFVADEPISTKMLGDILAEPKGAITAAIEQLQADYVERGSGLQIREVAGGWQIATRTEYHDEIRQFLKTRPSAKLSIASLETLAVIAYKQPVTVPEILDIRGVQSATSIKTLLDKRLIVAKGRKEAVGRPIQYGTSKEFLVQFGLKDLSELPSIEDFEDLSQGL
jgi:segregation and condensation protein B